MHPAGPRRSQLNFEQDVTHGGDGQLALLSTGVASPEVVKPLGRRSEEAGSTKARVSSGRNVLNSTALLFAKDVREILPCWVEVRNLVAANNVVPLRGGTERRKVCEVI